MQDTAATPVTGSPEAPAPDAETLAATHQQPHGQRELGRFRLGDELGRGGMGVVNAADDPALRRQVAVKLLLADRHADARAQFIEEAQITGQLEHPNIVPVHELGTDDRGRPFLAMKRVHGRTLRELINEATARGGCWSDDAPRFLEVFAKVCDAVGYAHSRRVVHRDLKPENIMVGAFGEVLVMDWGLAKSLDAPERAMVSSDRRAVGRNVTMDGEVFGTPSFMAPEQARGETGDIDERSDIFALGGILYSLLTLQPPYGGADTLQTVVAASRRDLVMPRQCAPKREIPVELEAIALMAMAERRSGRYATAAELKADIHAHIASLPVRARRDSLWTRAVKWARRHPTASMSSALSVVFVLIAGLLVSQVQASRQAARLADAEVRREAAERSQAEERAEREAAERARAEAETRLARAAEAAARGELSEVRSLLKSEGVEGADAAIREFEQRWIEKERTGQSIAAFMAALDLAKVARFLQAYTRLIDVVAVETDYQPTAQDYFNRAFLRACMPDGHPLADRDAVIADYSRVVEMRPDWAHAWNNRASSRRLAGDPAGAIADFNRALKLDPEYAGAWTGRGLARADQNDFDGAIADHTRALEIDPDNASTFNSRGVARALKHDWAGAVRDYDQALRLDPEYAFAYGNRATAKTHLDDVPGALSDFDRAIELDPRYVVAMVNRAAARRESGDLMGAFDDCDRAIRLAPGYAFAWFNRGLVRAARDDRAGAIADYTRAIELAPGMAEAWFNRGDKKHELDDLAGARADYDRAIQLNPAFAKAWGSRGAVRHLQGDLAGAIDDLDTAVRLEPESAYNWFMRGIARADSGDRAGALADCDRAIRLEPDNADAWYHRGRVRVRVSEWAAAIADFSRALELNDRDPLTWFNRAFCHQQLEDMAAAVRDYERAIALDPDNAVLWSNRGAARLQMGDQAGALTDFDRAIEVDPQHYNAWMNRGIVRINSNVDRAGGILDLQQAYRTCTDKTTRAAIARTLQQLGADVPE